MRSSLLILALLTPTLASARDTPEPTSRSFAAWQGCLRQQAQLKPPVLGPAASARCKVTEAAYLRTLAASPLLDHSDIARSRAGLRAQAAATIDPVTTGSIEVRSRR